MYEMRVLLVCGCLGKEYHLPCADPPIMKKVGRFEWVLFVCKILSPLDWKKKKESFEGIFGICIEKLINKNDPKHTSDESISFLGIFAFY